MSKLFKLLFFTSIIVASCMPQSEIESELSNNRLEFHTVANNFLKQDKIDWISIAYIYDENACHIINDWNDCPGHGTNSGSFDTALKRNEISKVEYDYYSNFLQQHNLDGIQRAYGCDNCVEFERKTFGLRFSQGKNHKLNKDNEYLRVSRIDSSWHSYTRDWN